MFPKKYLEGAVANGGLIDALANIAVIGPAINIRTSAKAPLDYVTRYEITPNKLEQQYIDPSFTAVPVSAFETWLSARAGRLAEAANTFLNSLGKGL